MRTVILLGCLVVGGPLVAALPQQPAGNSQKPAEQQTPVFRAAVDLVTVDVHVVDGDGRPVEGLRPEDFSILVEGKPRPIVTADYVSFPLTEGTAEPAAIKSRPSPRFSSNSGALDTSPSRTVFLVIDEANIRTGGGRTAAAAAEKFVDSLKSQDRVGVVTIPVGPAGIDPTSDRQAVKTALRSVVGHMVPMETKLDQVYSIGVSEAFALLHDRSGWRQILYRECEEKPRPESCPQEMTFYARSIIDDARQRMRETVTAFATLLTGMSQVPGPKTVVFVSEELPVAPYLEEQRAFQNEARAVIAAAARAQASVYVLHLHSQLFDVESRMEEHSTSRDVDMRAYGLEEVTAMTGGKRMMIAARSDPAFARVALEISGYYLLGFQAQAGDRDGKAHEIKVTVKRKGVDVRARKAFAFAAPGDTRGASAAASATPSDTVTGLLRSGDTALALPISLATYTVANPGTDDRIRLVITAEIGRGAIAPAELAIGYALTDGNGRNAGASVERLTLRPAAGHPDAPLCYTGAAILPPGSYTLRFVAADAALRAGTVVHRLEAHLASAGPVKLSDLLVLDRYMVEQGKPRPSVTATADDTVSAYVEVYATPGATIPEVTGRLELLESADAPPVAFGQMNIVAGDGRFAATGWVPSDALPAGTYLVRATISLGGKPAGSVMRAVQVVHPVEGGHGDARGGVDDGAR